MIKKRRKSIVVFDTYMLMANAARLPEVKKEALIDMLNEHLDDGDYIGIAEHSRRVRKLFGVSDTEFQLAKKLARTQAEIKDEIRCN